MSKIGGLNRDGAELRTLRAGMQLRLRISLVVVVMLASALLVAACATQESDGEARASLTRSTASTASDSGTADDKPTANQAATLFARKFNESLVRVHQAVYAAMWQRKVRVQWSDGHKLSSRRWVVVATIRGGHHRLHAKWYVNLPLEQLLRDGTPIHVDGSEVRAVNQTAKHLARLPAVKSEKHKPIALFVTAIGLDNGQLEAAATTSNANDPLQYLRTGVGPLVLLRGLSWSNENRLDGTGTSMPMDSRTVISVRGTHEHLTRSRLAAMFDGGAFVDAIAVWQTPPKNLRELQKQPIARLIVSPMVNP